MPMFATEVLHGDAHTLGMLTVASGVGAIIGALYLASRESVVGLARVRVWSTGLFGLGLIGLSCTRNTAMALLVLVGASGGMMVLTAASNTMLQTMVDNDKRGRVMSLYTTVFLGLGPVGSLVAGSVATYFGAPQTVRIGGVGCLLGAIVFAHHLPTLRDLIRPIYAPMGLRQAATLRTQRALDAYLHAHH